MTTDIAAALLADVPLHDSHHDHGGWMYRHDVLAALTAALDPALSERAGEVVARLREGMPEAFDATEGYAPSVSLAEERMADAADLLTALLTANAALRAERDEYKRLAVAGELAAKECRIWQGQAEAADAQIAALTARVERLKGALRDIEADCDADYPPSHGAIKQAARAALTTEERK